MKSIQPITQNDSETHFRRLHAWGSSPGFLSFDDESLWLNIAKNGDGYEATHELGVVFYGGMFGELTDHYRQG